MSTLSQAFSHFAETTARVAGKPATFLLAAAVIVVWAITGPIFQFNDTWQLVINTGTTIVTFLMVFLIQNSQNRDGAALQIKLDELIRTTHANNGLLDLEDVDEETLERVRALYKKLANQRQQQASAEKHPARRADKQDETDELGAETQDIEKELETARAARPAKDEHASTRAAKPVATTDTNTAGAETDGEKKDGLGDASAPAAAKAAGNTA